MKKLYFKISHNQEPGVFYVEPTGLELHLVSLAGLHEDSEPSLEATVTAIYLTDAEYEALPQWRNI